MESINYVLYSLIGPHAGKNPKQILSDKQNEINLCKEHFGLWAAKIDKKSIEQLWKLDKNARVVVLGKIRENLKDPCNKNGEYVEYVAVSMITPSGECPIPKGICTTFTKGKRYQAYKVKEYKILDPPIVFDFGKFEALSQKKGLQSFAERFKCTRFQNTFGAKNNQLNKSYTKEIDVIMELEYPFVVDIK